MTNTPGQLVRLQVHVGYNAAGGYLWSFDNPTLLQSTPTLLTGSPLPSYGPSGKKFIHITKPSTSIRKLKDELVSRYERIYRQSLDIESIRDEHECDLDDDYSVEQIFSDGGIVRVFSNSSAESASPLTASMKSPKNVRPIPPLADVVSKSPPKSPERLRNLSPVASRISVSPDEHKTKRQRIDDRENSSSPELMVMDSQGQLVSGAEDSQPSPTRTAVRFRGRVISERKPNLGTISGPEIMLPHSLVPDVERTPPTKRVEAWAETPVLKATAAIGHEMEPAKLTTEVNGAAPSRLPAPKSETVPTKTTAKHKRQNLAAKSPVNGVRQKSVEVVKTAAHLWPATEVENEDVSQLPMKFLLPASGSQSMSNGTTFATAATQFTPTKNDVFPTSTTINDDGDNESQLISSEDETNDNIDSGIQKNSESADVSHKPIHEKRAKESDSLQNDNLDVAEETNESGSDASDTECTPSSDSEQGAADNTNKQSNETPMASSLQASAKRQPISPEKPISLVGIVKTPLLEKRVPSFRSLSELAKLGVPDVRESTTGIRAIQSQIANDQKRARTKTVPDDSGSDTNESSDSDETGSSSDSDGDKSDDESGIPANRRASGVTKQEKEKKKRYSSGFRALFSM
ncbi:Cdc14 phosphatase binding protein N-terminus-domain-containing protein [Lipomyces kononenkoae]|uniref:Cdc14 phosphatase binding protein N-terminus-domain-containing protein n=1 Tax=Lipomyces kononenkoae TaxID=34357 RepID=A0ACC3T082_LIPKO